MNSTTGGASPLKLDVQDLLTTLMDTTTVDDFPTLKWPKLPDNPGNGIKLKLRTCIEKERKYFSIGEDCTTNLTRITKKRMEIDSQTVSSSRKVAATSSAVFAAINATKEVEKKYSEYKILLNASINEVEKIYEDLEASILTTSTTATVLTSTSTTLPVTSTCNTTLLPYGTYIRTF